MRLQVRLDRGGDIVLGWALPAGERRLSPAELRTQHLLREEVATWARTGVLRLRWVE